MNKKRTILRGFASGAVPPTKVTMSKMTKRSSVPSVVSSGLRSDFKKVGGDVVVAYRRQGRKLPAG